MNAAAVAARPPVASRSMPARLALLGTGTVGNAVLARLAAWEGSPLGARLALRYVANSRFGYQPASCVEALAYAGQKSATSALLASSLQDVSKRLGDRGLRIVIDATASEAVADCHAHWLAQGLHVVTACKLGQGTSLVRWRAIRDAQRIGKTHYGDSATVGAGLPLLRSIRALQAGGDRIHAIAGVLSGSMAWLFNHYDGLRPFSAFVRQARDAGYTEPDPRDDLSDEDVKRKLLIMARAAGVPLESNEVNVRSVLPSSLADLPIGNVDEALQGLDVSLSGQFANACKRGEKLRFVARLENGKARVGLESLPIDHALAGGTGTDNRVIILSDRYYRQPLVIQGPGAGAEVTAAGLLDDALEIAN
jgi:homoserine dehydrogenase